MADIFVSYSRLDQDRVRPIVERLHSLGYSVWWEKRRPEGAVALREIENQLAQARCVLTVWSGNGRNALSVIAESARALDENKLIQLRLDNAPAPTPFDALAIADLSGTRTEWGSLEHTLAQKIRGESQPDEAFGLNWDMLATAPAAGATKLLTIACSSILLSYVIAVVAAFSGIVSIDQMRFAMTGVMAIGLLCVVMSALRLFAVRRADA